MTNTNIGDWFTLSAVIVALFFGVWSIMQSNLIQKKQQRHALLKELIEWCTQIIEAVRLEEIPIIGNQDLEIARRRVFGNKIFKLLALDGKSDYMYRIAAITPNLQKKVKELQEKLGEISDLTFGQSDMNTIDHGKIYDKDFRELQDIASDIIVAATKIRTKNII